MWEKKLELYDKLVAKCPRFDRKGKVHVRKWRHVLAAKRGRSVRD